MYSDIYWYLFLYLWWICHSERWSRIFFYIYLLYLLIFIYLYIYIDRYIVTWLDINKAMFIQIVFVFSNTSTIYSCLSALDSQHRCPHAMSHSSQIRPKEFIYFILISKPHIRFKIFPPSSSHQFVHMNNSGDIFVSDVIAVIQPFSTYLLRTYRHVRCTLSTRNA